MHVHIAKVNGIIWSGEAREITVPGKEGEMTVLGGHVPLVTTLRPGRIIVRHKDGEDVFDVEEGICEVTQERTTVLL